MWQYGSEDLQQHTQFYRDVLGFETFHFGFSELSLQSIVEHELLHPLLQLVILDCAYQRLPALFQDLHLVRPLGSHFLFGISTQGQLLGDLANAANAQIATFETETEFQQQLRQHPVWSLLKGCLALRIEDEKQNLFALAVVLRHIFWRLQPDPKLKTAWASPEPTSELMAVLLAHLDMQSTYKATYENCMAKPQLQPDPESQIKGIDSLLDGFDLFLQHFSEVTHQNVLKHYSDKDIENFLKKDFEKSSEEDFTNHLNQVVEMQPEDDSATDTDEDFDFEIEAIPPSAKSSYRDEVPTEFKSEDMLGDEIDMSDNSEQKFVKTTTEDTKPVIDIQLQSAYGIYKSFLASLTLISVGRAMLKENTDLKADSRRVMNAVEIDPLAILLAVYCCPEVASVWASKIKKTTSSLQFPEHVTHVLESIRLKFPIRTYDHPERGNTVHIFRHLQEFTTSIHQKFVSYLPHLCEGHSIYLDETHFAEQLWDLVAQHAKEEHTLRFFQLNQPQSLGEIKKTNLLFSSYLEQHVKGQPEALRQVANAEMWSRFKTSRGLRALFTFLGPSGVGKTHLAHVYAEALDHYSSGYQLAVYNMENFSDERAAGSLIGSGAQYTDSSAGTLTYDVTLSPRSVLLFDEIEKAHPTVIQTLLTLIDTGRLIDATTMLEVDFSQCVVIFTSNLGHEIFDKAENLGDLDVLQVLREAKLRNSQSVALSPEFVNRLGAGATVRFSSLNTCSMLNIAEAQIRTLDEDDDGILDYELEPDLAAILMFAQLPQPSVRGFKAQQVNLLAEAKQLLFSDPKANDVLDDIRKLRLEVDPACFALDNDVGALLMIGDFSPLNIEVSARFQVYPQVQLAVLNPHQRPIVPAKLVGIFLSSHGLTSDELEQQLRLLQSYFRHEPLFLFTQDKVRGKISEPIWLQYSFEIATHELAALKNMLAVHWRLGLSARKQQGFSYRLKFKQYEEGRITFTVTEPQFKTQISVQRAEQGVTGLMKERPDLRLDQVIGLQRAKQQLSRVLQWLKQPDILASQHIAFPSGMLLAGPPGTGKTLLAKAVAGECELPFVSLSVGDLISGVRNGTAEKIDRAFKEAADIAPCIMFIDEIDTIASARKVGEISENNAVNVLLTHLDGIQKRAEPVFVLAATNFPQALDPALLRAGRLDEVIYCDLPDKAARKDFFSKLSAKYCIALPESEIVNYLDITQGMSGAQLDKIFRDYLYCIAAGTPESRLQPGFDKTLFRETIVNIRYGSANPNKTLSEESKVQVAWHEAGHLLMTKLLLPQHAINFATIEPRNQSLGFVSIQRHDALGASTASEIRSHIAVAMAGREAERLLSKNYDVTAGAVSDIEIATRYALNAVCEYGLDAEFGQLSASALTYSSTSTALQQLAEQRIRAWLQEGQSTAAALLSQHRTLLQQIAGMLLEKESLYADEISDIFEHVQLHGPSGL